MIFLIRSNFYFYYRLFPQQLERSSEGMAKSPQTEALATPLNLLQLEPFNLRIPCWGWTHTAHYTDWETEWDPGQAAPTPHSPAPEPQRWKTIKRRGGATCNPLFPGTGAGGSLLSLEPPFSSNNDNHYNDTYYLHCAGEEIGTE